MDVSKVGVGIEEVMQLGEEMKTSDFLVNFNRRLEIT